MSFYSSLMLARPTNPPPVKACDIGEFVRKLADIGVLDNPGMFLCDLKYGKRIDADQKNTDCMSWDESGLIASVGKYPWDVSKSFRTPDELIGWLHTDKHPIYRVHLTLSGLPSEIVKKLTRDADEANESPLTLADLSFSIGPVTTHSLDGEIDGMVGWMALSFSGYGYYYPWSFREARERAEKIPLVRKMMETCRTMWPVEESSVPSRLVQARKDLGNLWLYDDHAIEQDWRWYVAES